MRDHLHPPFSYLSTLVAQKDRENEEGSGSEFVTLGVPKKKTTTWVVFFIS